MLCIRTSWLWHLLVEFPTHSNHCYPTVAIWAQRNGAWVRHYRQRDGKANSFCSSQWEPRVCDDTVMGNQSPVHVCYSSCRPGHLRAVANYKQQHDKGRQLTFSTLETKNRYTENIFVATFFLGYRKGLWGQDSTLWCACPCVLGRSWGNLTATFRCARSTRLYKLQLTCEWNSAVYKCNQTLLYLTTAFRSVTTHQVLTCRSLFRFSK